MRGYICVFIMLVSCTGYASATMATPPDAVVCQYDGRMRDASTSNETFNAWVQHYQPYDSRPLERNTTTQAADAMTVDLTSSKYFRGHIGGGGGTWAMYDAQHRVLAYCQMYDTAEGLFVAGNIGPPPFAVARGDLSALASRSGVGLGSTISDVRRVYGPAPTVYVNGKPELRYLRSIRIPGSRSLFVISTSFVLVDGKVAQIARISGV
jgi:hypothetical protein